MPPRRRLRARFSDGEEVDSKEATSGERRLRIENYLERRRGRPATLGEMEAAFARHLLQTAEAQAERLDTPAGQCVIRVMRVLKPLRLGRLEVEAILSHGLGGPAGRRRKLPLLPPLPEDVRQMVSQTAMLHMRIAARLGVTRADALAALDQLWRSRRGRPRAISPQLYPLIVAHYNATLVEQRAAHASRRGSHDLSRIGEPNAHERALSATAERLRIAVSTVRAALRERRG